MELIEPSTRATSTTIGLMGPPSGWFKMNFNGSAQSDKVEADFIIKNNVRVLVGIYCISVASILMSEVKI